MTIRRFLQEDAEIVSNIIRRNFLEININDYSKEEMEKLAISYDADKVLQVAGSSHMYVACDENNKPIASGAIASFWSKPDESILLTIFVLPEWHGHGIGRSIIEALEKDDLFLQAKRIEIPASITACNFYRKMGYDFKDGIKQLDDENLYRMEKFRSC